MTVPTALERSGQPLAAAQVSIDRDDWGRAIRSLQQVALEAPEYVVATNLLIDAYQRWPERTVNQTALGLVCLVALIALARFGDAPRLLLPCLVAATAATAIGAALNRVTKISVHMGAATGSALLLARLAPAASVPLASTRNFGSSLKHAAGLSLTGHRG